MPNNKKSVKDPNRKGKYAEQRTRTSQNKRRKFAKHERKLAKRKAKRLSKTMGSQIQKNKEFAISKLTNK